MALLTAGRWSTDDQLRRDGKLLREKVLSLVRSILEALKLSALRSLHHFFFSCETSAWQTKRGEGSWRFCPMSQGNVPRTSIPGPGPESENPKSEERRAEDWHARPGIAAFRLAPFSVRLRLSCAGVPRSGPPMSAASMQGGYQPGRCLSFMAFRLDTVPGPMNSMPGMGSMPAMPGHASWGRGLTQRNHKFSMPMRSRRAQSWLCRDKESPLSPADADRCA